MKIGYDYCSLRDWAIPIRIGFSKVSHIEVPTKIVKLYGADVQILCFQFLVIWQKIIPKNN